MQSARGQRWLGIAGLVFVVLLVASFFIPPATPNEHASAAKVVAYYHDHKGVLQVVPYLIELAVVVGVFFFWFLRERLSTKESNRPLATVAFGGALIFAVGGALQAGIMMSANRGVNHVDPTTMQTLNVLANDLSNFVVSAGAAIFLFATAFVLIRSEILPKWLGWVSGVLGVVSLVLPGIGAPAMGLWALIASIVILVASGRTAATPAASVP
jgi:hypothetical protein